MNNRFWPKYLACLALIGAVLLTTPSASLAQLEKEQVMTALLYNFSKFVTWPEQSFADGQAPLVIAVIGRGPLQEQIISLDGKQVAGRPIAVSRLPHYQLQADDLQCHILYTPQSNPHQLAALLKKTASRSILTVSDMPSFSRKGGILHLESGPQSVSFAINLDSADQAGLIISSKLFPLASTIIKGGQVKEAP